jgi:glycyl-tRNA synthetase beta chain
MNPAAESIITPTEKPNRGELLLELLSEEIPARMQRRAIDDLVGLLGDKLAAAQIPAAGIRGYVTPRRLAVIAEGVAAAQPDRSEERRGPRVGAPQTAIDGFLRAAGLASVAACEVRDTGRGEFYFAVLRHRGQPAAEVLPQLVAAAITELPWPKSMRWPGAGLRWVRPLTSILCVFDGEVVPVAIAGVPVGRASRGHRVMSPGGFCASSAGEYLDKLQHAFVILDHQRRRERIRSELDRRADELGVRLKPDPGLLDEVTGLAEFPVVLAGAVDPDFMGLAPEVLQTAMRAHQRYFSCADAVGRPAPHFLFVADNLPEDGGAAIVAGNERVLRARLADARFFWDQDRKIRLADRIEALKQRVYHARLGSVYDKVRRMEALSEFLAQHVPGADPVLARRAAHLAKADLSTGMVGEFPELQGIIGRYYALGDGEDRRVANAIAEHYKPLGPGDDCPTEPVSVIAALADKIDTLVAFFAIGEKPTGSRDPFALRRAAQGLIRLVLENRLRLPLARALRHACSTIAADVAEIDVSGAAAVVSELLTFVADRLKVHLRDRGVRHDLIAAVLRRFGVAAIPFTGGYEDDLVRLLARVGALAAFLASDDGANLLVAYRRASNIVMIEDRKDGCARTGDVADRLLRLAEEKALSRQLAAIDERARNLLDEERFEEAMTELARLRQPVDAFFDKVTVNTDEPELRENRLRLLAHIRDTMNRVADFSQIEG